MSFGNDPEPSDADRAIASLKLAMYRFALNASSKSSSSVEDGGGGGVSEGVSVGETGVAVGSDVLSLLSFPPQAIDRVQQSITASIMISNFLIFILLHN